MEGLGWWLVELDFKYELREAMDDAGFRQLPGQFFQVLLSHSMLEVCLCQAFPGKLSRNDDVGEALVQERLAPRSPIVGSDFRQLRFGGKASSPIVNGSAQTVERCPSAPRLAVCGEHRSAPEDAGTNAKERSPVMIGH